MNKLKVVVLVINLYCVFGNFTITDQESRRIKTIVELIKSNFKTNGWHNIMCVGTFPDSFYEEIKDVDFTFTSLDVNKEEQDIENAVPFYSNIVIISCKDVQELEKALLMGSNSPYWHPLANIILYYHSSIDTEHVAKLLFIFWYQKVSNAIIVTYNDDKEYLKAYYYNQYTDERSKLSNKYGCWSKKKSGIRIINNFENNFVCVKGCHNITVTSELRAYYLGTCLGFDYHKIEYGDKEMLNKVNLFEDKCKDFNGFILRVFAFETKPFMIIDGYNGTYTIRERDGMLWNTLSELMNFRMDFSAVKDIMKNTFAFDVTVQYVFDFTKRYADILIVPVYQFDVIVVEVDYTLPFTDSGVCIVSHRADYQTVLVDEKLLINSYEMFIRFILCFIVIWMSFFFYNAMDKKRLSLDQLGMDLLNTCRCILSISLYKPPKRQSFRIVITTSTWGYFLINFAMQAAIISFFTAHKRGKEVDTFEDVIEKGYYLEGMASPDVLLPDTEEIFSKINEKIYPVQSMLGCMDLLRNDSKRFCLNDCTVARFFARNKLDDNGEQYLHVASKDRMHSHYLNMFMQKHSPMTDNYNKYVQRMIEAGLIKKWEEYRFNDIKETTPTKSISLYDLATIFRLFLILSCGCCVIFLLEIGVGWFLNVITGKWHIRRVVR